MKVGYTTGTFDWTHTGHFNILKYMYELCDRLMVGLTTDELAEKQKRKTLMNFEQRRAILENCKYVTCVVEHNGDSKQIAYEKLHFDILFIGDDYFHSKEYREFAEQYPHVQLITIPRTSHISTSGLLQDYDITHMKRWEILHLGVGSSSVRLFHGYQRSYVTKSINVGSSEINSRYRTDNVYQLPFPYPRNWTRRGNTPQYPNFPGVNAFREIDGSSLWMGRSWFPFFELRRVFKSDPTIVIPKPTLYHSDHEQNYERILKEKNNPSEVYELIGNYAGMTLASWIQTQYNRVYLEQIIRDVSLIIQEMMQSGFVHGDIHCRNVLVSEKLQVSLVDFGWCTHSSFNMSSDEVEEHKRRLQQYFDWGHFRDSLEQLLVDQLQRPDIWNDISVIFYGV